MCLEYKPLVFQPGFNYEYCNSGYDSHSDIILHRASGYEIKPDGLRNTDFLDMSLPYAAGSIYSTTQDLLIWQEKLFAGKIISSAFVLKKHQLLDLFDFIDCNKALFSKKRALNRLIKQRSLNTLTTYYVGDEVRDIEAAHGAKIHAIAVSWGFNSVARLKLANPDHLISHIEELLSLSFFIKNDIHHGVCRWN